MTPSSNDPAEARKRRKEIIQSQRSENELIANEAAALAANGSTAVSATTNGINGKSPIIGVVADVASTAATTDANGNGAEKKPPKKRKVTSGDSSSRKNSKKTATNGSEAVKQKKTQIRYDPDVPMNKDQLAAWRREARRVRNRESAAASRQRIRNRISELEDEVGEWKAKYSQAIQRLDALEKCISTNAANNAGLAAQQELAVLAVEQQPQPQEASDQPPVQLAAPSVALPEETKDPASGI